MANRWDTAYNVLLFIFTLCVVLGFIVPWVYTLVLPDEPDEVAEFNPKERNKATRFVCAEFPAGNARNGGDNLGRFLVCEDTWEAEWTGRSTCFGVYSTVSGLHTPIGPVRCRRFTK